MSKEQEINEFHLDIVRQLSALNKGVEGINRRLDITNGRIAKNETLTDGNKQNLALLEQSFKQYDSEQKYRKSRMDTYRDWAVKGVVGFVLTTLGVLLLAGLQKLGIVNLSIVDAATYAEIQEIAQ